MEQSDLDLLHTVPLYHLQSLMKLCHLPHSSQVQSTSATSPSSTPTAAEVAQQLFNPTTLNEAIGSLTETEMLLLKELVACGGRANSRDLALYLESSGLVPSGKEAASGNNFAGYALGIRQQAMPISYPNPHPHGVFELALRRLLLPGLLFWGKQTNFAGRDYTSGVYDGVLIVPQAVKQAVKEFLKSKESTLEPQAHTCPLGSPCPPTTDRVPVLDVGEGIRALQRTLYLYWSLVANTREGLPLVNSGLLSRSALRLVVELLSTRVNLEQIRTEHEVPHLLFLRLLLTNLGLLQVRQGALHAAPADAFFSLPVVERARRCYRLWLETPFWNELQYLPEVMVRPGPTPLEPAHEEVLRARQTLLDRVFQEQSGEWLELSAFIARTKLYAPYLLFPRQYGPRVDRYSMGSNPYGWDFRLRRGWLTHREGWHLVEGGFIRAVISGPLNWLGLVDVKGENSAATFCITPAASLITSDVAPDIEEVPCGRLIVQPNFELVALAPVSESLLLTLDRFAERLSLEHVAQYRLTKASITRAIQIGLHAESIQQDLEQAAGGELPQNVQYSLVEWERQARRIELWPDVTLLEVDDAALLDALFADTQTRALLGRRLAPLLAEVAPHQLEAVQEVLWQRDYLSALASAPAHDDLLEHGRFVAREPQWRLHEDGLLEPLYAVLDLYLVAEVERISEPDGVTTWRRITSAAIQRAREAGLSLEAIVRFLQQYCEDGVPVSFLIRLKLWGGGYAEQSSIQIEQAPMLYLSAEVLQDLQADDELKDLLSTEVAQQGRLVRIAPEHLEQVVQLLRERGFVVE